MVRQSGGYSDRGAVFYTQSTLLCVLHDRRRNRRGVRYWFTKDHTHKLRAPVRRPHLSRYVSHVSGCNSVCQRAIRTFWNAGSCAKEPSRLVARWIGFWERCRRVYNGGCDFHHSDRFDLSFVCTVSMAARFVATKHYASGDDHLVVVVSVTCARHLVFTQVPATPNLTGSDFHHDAFPCL